MERKNYDKQVMEWFSNHLSNQGSISLGRFLKICLENKVLMQSIKPAQQATLTSDSDNPIYQIILVLDEGVLLVRLKFLTEGFDLFRYFILYQDRNIFVRLIFPISSEPDYDKVELQDLKSIKNLL